MKESKSGARAGTRRAFLAHTIAATASAAGLAPLAAGFSVEKTTRFAHRGIARIKTVIRREETVLRHGGNGDNWHMSWAADDRQYLSLCDGSGFSGAFRASYNSRMFAIEGGPQKPEFLELPGYPLLGQPMQKSQNPRYYNYGTLALDGHLYQFMSTFNGFSRPDRKKETDSKNSLRYVGAKLIYSPDGGRTWCNQNGSTPVTWEDWSQQSRETMMFLEEDQEAFSLLTILQMGRNYEHNRDGYVYVYAPNGNTDGAMNELVLFRVPKAQILDRRAYEYFGGLRSSRDANWSTDINARKSVHTFPRGWVNQGISWHHPYAWHPSVVYNAPLGAYLMVNWGMGCSPEGDWFGKPSYLGFWIARDPWGPWTQIHEETRWLPAGDANARAYQPQIAPKWIAPDGKSFWLVWTDFQIKGDKSEYERLNEPFVKKGYDNLSFAEWAQKDTNMRQFMPYYAFNAQRVDLIL